MQHGLNSSSGRDGLNCWSSWYDSMGAGAARGFLWWGVTARRDGGMQPTASAREIITILALSLQRAFAAADGQAVGRRTVRVNGDAMIN